MKARKEVIRCYSDDLFTRDPCRIQTCNPHIRSVVLYSVELMDPLPIEKDLHHPRYHTSDAIFLKSGCKGTAFF